MLFEIESAVEIPGWGQLPPNIIDDAISRVNGHLGQEKLSWIVESYTERLIQLSEMNPARSRKAIQTYLKFQRLLVDEVYMRLDPPDGQERRPEDKPAQLYRAYAQLSGP